MMSQRVAIYPGSFDPITNGHISIVQRGLKIFDKIIVAILLNPKKQALFSLEERIIMIKDTFKDEPNLEIDMFDGLLVDYAVSKNTNIVLRGLRAMSDFENEFQMALMNRKLNRDIQSVFLMTEYKWFYTSSTIVKEAASMGGDVSGLVPPEVNNKLKRKYMLMKSSLETIKDL
jgi:pantetheine-phosphate adenylyltransferase, bacterial